MIIPKALSFFTSFILAMNFLVVKPSQGRVDKVFSVVYVRIQVSSCSFPKALPERAKVKRVFFFHIPAFAVWIFFFASPVWGQPGTNQAWWDQDWRSRLRIKIENQAGIELPEGYSLPVAFDHLAWVRENRSLANGDDLRVVYQPEEGQPVELDRILEDGFSWNESLTTILFSTQEAIPGETVSDDYWLYFDNPEAENPPGDPSQVFVFFEDFEELELLPFPRYEWCSGDWCRSDQFVFPEVSEEKAFSGSKSLKLTGPGSPAGIYTTSSLKDYRLRVRFYTTDPATEAGLYFRGWGFSGLYPLFAFFWGGYQLDTGRGLYLANSCRPPDCSFPQPGEWNSLEVKVVGNEISGTRANNDPVWWLDQPESLDLPDDQGDRVGFLYLFPWGQEPQPLYYDDLTLRRAVEREPVLSLEEEESQLPLPIPGLVFPENGALINLNPLVFRWETGQEGEEDEFDYQIEIGTASDFRDEEKAMATTGESSYLPSLPLGEGNYFWRVRVVSEGKEGDWSEIWRFGLDFSPPETNLVEKPESKTAETWARFVWSGEDNFSDDLSFSFRSDEGEWAEFGDQTKITLNDLVEGEHNFSVRAKDEAGNLGDQVSFFWWVETSSVSLPADDFVSEEDEGQPPLVLEILSQKEIIVERLEAGNENKNETPTETVSPSSHSSPNPERKDVLGETTASDLEPSPLGSKKEGGNKEIWFLVLKMAGLSSLLVAVGYFTARLR